VRYIQKKKRRGGEEAIEKTDKLKPNLVIMDIFLNGEMDGITAIEEIKTRHDIPFIYITAHSDKKTLNRAKATEPYGYILKPINQKELYSSIEIALYKYDMEIKLKESEEKLRIMFDSIGDGIIVTDLEADIIEVNNSILRMGKYSNKEEIIGRNALDFVSPKDHEKAMENLSKELEAGLSAEDVELFGFKAFWTLDMIY